MSWINDVSSVLVAAGVGVENTNIFHTSKSMVQTGSGPYLVIIETSGAGTDNIHNSAPLPGYEWPGAQILVRAAVPTSARTMILAAYRALVAVKNQSINGTHYLWIKAMQVPFDMGMDDSGKNIIFAFNIVGHRSF